MDGQGSTELQEARRKIEELEDDKQKRDKLLLSKQANDTALATVRQGTSQVIHRQAKEILSKALEQARALIERDHSQDRAALLTGSEPFLPAASPAVDLTGDSDDDNAKKPDQEPPLTVPAPPSRQAHGQPQAPSIFNGQGQPTRGAAQDTNRDGRAKRRRVDGPAEQSHSSGSTDTKHPPKTGKNQWHRGKQVIVGFAGEDHIVDEATELDPEVKEHIKKLTASQRAANMKQNHDQVQRCIRMQYKSRKIQPWSDSLGACDWCKAHGTQCVVFILQDRVFLMDHED